MNYHTRDNSATFTDTASEVITWMRERTSEELQAFISRRLAVVEQEVIE